jgi:hypothetical protein
MKSDSDFLAFLLNPRESHGLDDQFLKGVLRAALEKQGSGLSPLEIHTFDMTASVVFREWKSIDILVSDLKNRLLLVFENKIDTTEHDDQLSRYERSIEDAADFKGWTHLFFYLTPFGERPSSGQWLPLSYTAVNTAIKLCLDSVSNVEVEWALRHYSEVLERNVMEDSKFARICREIYSQHKEAFDLVNEHVRQQQTELRRVALDYIHDQITPEAFQLVRPSRTGNSYLRYELAAAAPSQGLADLVYFYFWNDDAGLVINATVEGHGKNDARTEIYEMAGEKPFERSVARDTFLKQKQNTIFVRRLLELSAYSFEKEQFTDKLKEQWERVVPELTCAINRVATFLADRLPSTRVTSASG